MFSYYGSKSKFDRIIEPFAGSARYSLKWFDRDVLLVDKYDVIVKIWHYLQQASENDILGLPEPEYKKSINNLNISENERLLLGFLVNRGSAIPKINVQQFSDIHEAKIQISSQLYKIRHWEIRQGEYKDITNEDATWFIDPPYQNGGEHYKHGNDKINFSHLAKWCQSRQGQVIVCENTKADWMPFHPMRKLNGAYSKTTEAIWSNYHTGFESKQLELFKVQR